MNAKNTLPIWIILTLIWAHTATAQKYKLLEMKTGIEKTGISYKESLKKWQQLKATNGNSYVYQRKFGSWTGYGFVTQITVINDTVVSRIYESFQLDHSTGKIHKDKSYNETKKQIGTHTHGHEAITIDELYKKGKEAIDVDKDDNEIYFSTFENGLLHICGHNPKACADDCFHGVSIFALEWIK